MEEIVKFVEEQLESLAKNKELDAARIDGFYSGAQTALTTVLNTLKTKTQNENKQKTGKTTK